ncbi:SGNH/GDSL hydrolase family protein [Arachidicoccus soli]|uniref:SGNH/GDSL hydrolase family protein n=1 Tax=Arachidicoccus soli TaxID=2341117 RepID=A0A386HQB3_9BACT|nr:SGNH/GDSL hydrolase family protein [Arachidicoccus soli]AYD47882.1 SGNH/GDSL hydrolase family protein [Arachidicoccus soli]
MQKKNGLMMFLMLLTGIACMSFKDKVHGKIVCFGDSITYGAKVDGHSWVWHLQQANYPGVSFINEGRSGRKTADKKELLPVLQRHADADYYLIFLGVNDLKDGNAAMVNSCIENMQWMVDQIHAADAKAKIVILSPSAINLNTMSQVNVAKKYNENTSKSLKALEKKYKALARKDHLGFISLLNTVSKPNYADGLHPDLKGQQQIAAAVWKGLNKIY